ncbi:UNVERIFIED_CONTAM: hypothetical protein HDU68_009335 [Siphonaria sp. JEL0065]|nr:hypothetical protein HDU68_009335 [Siphonaria sp. JEL0065]
MKLYNLLPSEQTVAGSQLPSMESITFYNGTPPLSYLKSRVQEMIFLNPFLAGRFHINTPKSKNEKVQFAVPCSEAGSLYALDLDHHFKVVDCVDIDATRDFIKVCKTLAAIPHLAVPNAAACLATNSPVFRVAVLIHPSKTKFALYLTLCHGIGDGHCFYTLYKMLSATTTPHPMIFDRVQSYEKSVWELLPDIAIDLKKEENMGLPVFGSMLGLVGCVVSELVRVSVNSLVYGKSVWGVVDGPTAEWIQVQKKVAKQESNCKTFVSTNDCVSSWFLTETKCDYGSIAVNARVRVPEVSVNHFGNYLTCLYYKRADFASPLLIRGSLVGPVLKRRATTDCFGGDGKFVKRIGFVTNWAGFYEDVVLEECELLRHQPVLDVMQVSPYATCIVYAERKGSIKAISNFPELLRQI